MILSGNVRYAVVCCMCIIGIVGCESYVQAPEIMGSDIAISRDVEEINLWERYSAKGCFATLQYEACVLYPFSSEDGGHHLTGDKLLFSDDGVYAYANDDEFSVSVETPTIGVLWDMQTQSFCGTHSHSELAWMGFEFLLVVMPAYDHVCDGSVDKDHHKQIPINAYDKVE